MYSFCQDHSKDPHLQELILLVFQATSMPFKTIEIVLQYWAQKRASKKRPLIRRIQDLWQEEINSKRKKGPVVNSAESYKSMFHIRQGMERVRILLDLSKKREECKRDYIQMFTDTVEMAVVNALSTSSALSAALDTFNIKSLSSELIDPKSIEGMKMEDIFLHGLSSPKK